MNFVWIRIKSTFREAQQIYRENGFKAVFKRFGWRLVVGIFIYYLVRDLTLYVLIPWLIFKGFTGLGQ